MNDIPTPSIDDLYGAFQELERSERNGVRGIERWDSGLPGPNVAMTALTHGNEPSGLAPYWYLRHVAPHLRPIHGSLTFTANNIEATHRFFQAVHPEERRRSRLIDINMNRLPTDLLQRTSDVRYEIRRALDVYQQLLDIDAALDIHSTSQEADPMILQIKGSVDHLTNGLPIPVSIDDIAKIQVGIPFCSTYGGMNRIIPVFEIEAGSHEQPTSYQLAIRAALIFLLNSGIMDDTHGNLQSLKTPTMVRRHYTVVNSILLPNETYELVRDFPPFSPVNAGEVLAIGDGEPVRSPIDGHAIFAPAKRKPVSINDEALFLTSPVEERIVSSS